MMDGSAGHIGFIVAAYAFTAAVIATLAAYAVLERKAQLAALARLERGGARRRAVTPSTQSAPAREIAP